MKYKILTKPQIKYLLSNKHLIDDEIAKQIIVSRGYYDRNFFIDYFLSHHKQDKKTKEPVPSADFQIDMQEKMRTEKLLNVIYPRDHAKTTNSLFDSAHDIAYELEPYTLLVASEGLGVEFIGKVRNEFITNDKLIACFGSLVPGASRSEANYKFTAKHLQFTNGCEIETVSKGGTARGKRPTKLKVDDPQENKDVKNPRIAKEFIDRFFSSIFNTLDPSGRCISIGTILSDLCFVNILDQQDRGFLTIKYPAVLSPRFEKVEKGHVVYNDDGEEIIGRGRMHLLGGTPIRASKWTLKALDDRLQTIGRDAFMQEFMHEPMSAVGELVIPRGTTYNKLAYTPDTEFPELYLYRPPKAGLSYGVDTAKGLSDGDFSTITVRDDVGRLYASFKKRMAPDVLCKVIDRLRQLGYKPKRKALGIEVNNTGLVTITEARNYRDENGNGYQRYRYIYAREVFDKVSQLKTESIGWDTNVKTRPLMVEGYKKHILTDQTIDEFDEREVEERKTFAYDEDGKAQAPSPYHDDLILSDMVCMQMMKVQRREGVTV